MAGGILHSPSYDSCAPLPITLLGYLLPAHGNLFDRLPYVRYSLAATSDPRERPKDGEQHQRESLICYLLFSICYRTSFGRVQHPQHFVHNGGTNEPILVRLACITRDVAGALVSQGNIKVFRNVGSCIQG